MSPETKMPGSDDLKFGLKLTLEDGVSGPAAKISDELKKVYEEAERDAAAFKDLKEGMTITVDEFLRLQAASEKLAEAEKQVKEETKHLAEETKRLAREAREAEKQFDEMTREIDRAGNAFLALGGIIAGVFVLGATKGLKLLTDEEKTLAGLTGWLGSADEAYRTLGEAREFAYTAGFAETEITGGDPLLLAMGIDPKNLAHTRTVISDLARSMGKEYAEALQATTSGTFGLYRSLRYTFGVDIKAEDFEEAGRFVGLTVIEALEQVLRERGKEVGELTEEFADTMTAKLARVQGRFDEVLREGTRALFDAIGDDLNSLLDWFEEAAASGELEEMISGLAAGLEIVFGIVHDLLGVFTGLMDFFGAENVAKIAAFVAKWALFTGVATKVTSGIFSIIGAVKKAGGVMAWFAANPATAWIAAIGAAIGVIMLLTEAFKEMPLDEIAESYGELMSEVEGHQKRVNALTKEYENNRDRMEELSRTHENWIKLSPEVLEAHRLETEQLELKNRELETSIELEKELMRVKAQEAFQKMVADWERLEREAGGADIGMQVADLIGRGQIEEARKRTLEAYHAGEITETQRRQLIMAGALEGGLGWGLVGGAETTAASVMGSYYGGISEAQVELGELAAGVESYAGLGLLEKGQVATARELGALSAFSLGPGYKPEAVEEIITPLRTGGTLGGGGGGGPADVLADEITPRLSFAVEGEVAQPAATFPGGKTKIDLHFTFNVPVDENMANYVAGKAKEEIAKVFDRSGVL